MRKHIKYNNNTPHFFGKLPPFYKYIVDIYRKHIDLVDINPNKIYNTLVTEQLEPLDRQLKRLGVAQPVVDIFKDLHTNPHFTHKQKNIFYRLLFSITPTGYGPNTYCRFCNTP